MLGWRGVNTRQLHGAFGPLDSKGQMRCGQERLDQRGGVQDAHEGKTWPHHVSCCLRFLKNQGMHGSHARSLTRPSEGEYKKKRYVYPRCGPAILNTDGRFIAEFLCERAVPTTDTVNSTLEQERHSILGINTNERQHEQQTLGLKYKEFSCRPEY